MTDRVLDIWAIQNYPNEIYTALKNITNDVVIFKHLICKFKIGNKLVQTCLYDSVIYSEGSDTLIMLKRDGKATIEQAEKYFDEHDIDYHVVDFMPTEQTQIDGENKEFWFARDGYVVEDAVEDSIEKGNTFCKYAPHVKSCIIFKYPVHKAMKNSSVLNARYLDDEFLLKISFRGLVEFGDKYILPTISQIQRNLYFSDVMHILNKYKIDVQIDENIENFSI